MCKSVCKNARYISLRERACGASVRHQSARNGERCVYWSWYCEPDVKDRRALCANVIWIVNMCLLYNKYLQLNNSRLLYILPPSFHPYTHHPFHHWCRCGLKSPVTDLPIRPWVSQQERNEAQQMKYYHGSTAKNNDNTYNKEKENSDFKVYQRQDRKQATWCLFSGTQNSQNQCRLLMTSNKNEREERKKNIRREVLPINMKFF